METYPEIRGMDLLKLETFAEMQGMPGDRASGAA